MNIQSKRLEELDHIRVLSMIAVILLHTTSTYIFGDSRFTLLSMNAAFILNQAARFAVPAFILISGISLSFSKNDIPFSEFLKKRTKKIILPYLFWCVIYYLYNNNFSLQNINAVDFFKGILTGSFAVHLYFVVVMLQLYLIYFFLKRFIEKHRSHALILSFAITFFFQESIYLNCFGIRILPEFLSPYSYLLFPTWLFYFVAGMCLSRENLGKIIKFGREHLWSLIIAVLSYLFLFAIDSKLTNSYESSIKPIILPYTALVLVTACSVASFLKQRSRIYDFIIRELSKISYTVYLCHILFICLFNKLGFFTHGIYGFILLFAAVFLSSILFSWVADRIFAMFKRKI